MTQQKSPEGKIIFADARIADDIVRRVRREIEIVANNPDSIIKKLGEINIDEVYAVVLNYLDRNTQDLRGLTRIISEAQSRGYDDKLVVYSSISVETALAGTFVMPFRHDEDFDSLITYLNKSK